MVELFDEHLSAGPASLRIGKSQLLEQIEQIATTVLSKVPTNLSQS
jgi:hypothetical protein